MDILTVKGLSKSFGEKQVLDKLDLSVPKNSIFGFVGRNGAGKTTTMKAVLGLISSDEGEITVDGERVSFGETPTNRNIGYLPDVPEFYPFMTAREYLWLCGECLDMPKDDIKTRSEELLSLVGLENENKRIKGYSRGMKQRLGIASALLSRPKLLICDEPTSALDPIGRKEILDLLLSVREQTTVLFSTHVLSDVERICTDVAFLHNGKIAMHGNINELKKLAGDNDKFFISLVDSNATAEVVTAFPKAQRVAEDAVIISGGEGKMYAVLDFLRSHEFSIQRVERAASSLESLFLEVVKE